MVDGGRVRVRHVPDFVALGAAAAVPESFEA